MVGRCDDKNGCHCEADERADLSRRSLGEGGSNPGHRDRFTRVTVRDDKKRDYDFISSKQENSRCIAIE